MWPSGTPGWLRGWASAFSSGRDPGVPGFSPTWGSYMEPASSPSACVSASLSSIFTPFNWRNQDLNSFSFYRQISIHIVFFSLLLSTQINQRPLHFFFQEITMTKFCHSTSISLSWNYFIMKRSFSSIIATFLLKIHFITETKSFSFCYHQPLRGYITFFWYCNMVAFYLESHKLEPLSLHNFFIYLLLIPRVY